MSHEDVEIVTLVGWGCGVETGQRAMLAAAEFGMEVIKKGGLGGMLGAQLDFVEQRHCTTAKMGVIN